MATDSSAEQIQREMREVRADLRGNVQEMMQQAGGLTDWQEYVKAYPWLALGAAAVVGYLVVPSRPMIIQPDAKQLLELAKSQNIHLQTNQPARPGIVGSLVGMAGSMVMQAGMSALSTYLAQLQQSASPPPQDTRWREV